MEQTNKQNSFMVSASGFLPRVPTLVSLNYGVWWVVNPFLFKLLVVLLFIIEIELN